MPLHQISRFRFVNGYLVEEDDGLTLVDTLLPRSEGRVLAAAAALGQPIRRIALTHAHQDHIGSLDALAAALPDVEVLISARDARLLAGDKSIDPDEPQTKLRGGITGAQTRPTRTVAAGDRIGSLEVHASPGHTPGHLAFFDPRDRALYAGDSWSTFGGVATGAKSARCPLPAMVTWHKPTALASARSVRALDPAFLATGHGKVVADPGAAMDRALARGA